jgi:ATP-binding cassette subfamily G (WHITE) protein 2 (PDR)
LLLLTLRRKRVSIAEVILSQAPLALWDNSTRGLDSATAISFCQSIKHGLHMTNGVAAVAIYQAPQPAYDCFDKVRPSACPPSRSSRGVC